MSGKVLQEGVQASPLLGGRQWGHSIFSMAFRPATAKLGLAFTLRP